MALFYYNYYRKENLIMLNEEEFEALINSIKEKLGEETSALLAEDLLNILSNYVSALDKLEEDAGLIESLNKDKDELLKVNGKLFQKVGFDKEEEEKAEDGEEFEEAEPMEIDEVIDEEGELL
jgi:hypothetical protein